jgi:radical SAM protein with 4Fe4S-binding SPASM domain
MNLIITDKCTNSCPYCFASIEMQKNKALKSISKTNIDILLDFISKEKKAVKLNVIGGEPFIYKHLDYLLCKLTSEKNIEKAVIFTGGIFIKERLKLLEKYKDKILLLFNVNEQTDYTSKKQYETLLENISYALQLGLKTNLGFNIYKKSFNYKEIIDLCHSFGIEQIRWSIACPQYNDTNDNIISPGNYREISSRVLQFLEYAFTFKIQANLDCPIPKCFFSSTELSRVANIQPHIIEKMNICEPVIDIGTDLSVFRCFAFSEHYKKKLTDFENFDTIRGYFRQNIDEKLIMPNLMPDCHTCENATAKICKGGCFAHNKIDFALPVEDELLTKAFKLLKSGNPEKALNMMSMINRKDAAVSLLYAYIYFELNDYEECSRWARMTINRGGSEAVISEARNMLNKLCAYN